MPLPSIPEYSTCIKNPQLLYPSILKNGHPIEIRNTIKKYSGGFCVVFPFETPTNKYAVRCWHAAVSDAQKRSKLIADAIKDSQLPYFVKFDYFDKGIMTPQGEQPIIVMDWVNAQTLKDFLAENINDSGKIEIIAENFKNMVADLHRHHFAHGDLQHGNIMIRQDNSIVLVDYDSMYVPALQGMPDDIKGLAGYQHESRLKNEYTTEKVDYFSELIIYLSLKALAKMPALWKELNIENTETLLFSSEDIKSKGTSSIFIKLRNNATLRPMVDKLCSFMKEDCLENLEPLEQALISEREKSIEAIRGIWSKGNGYTPPSIADTIKKVEDNIITKFKQNR